ncbi:hypothetical protein L1987_58227 [Smallanthus sonchifolius]|uniref:Uncharacterized protein n=1 Tax=Smallanthus sonchifolius TaxID=185202 RepID=A0ACB9DF26_9ASTR|nr:hypothetical protein L1987_58227 [Smallanthus sonchifolius]
MSPAVNDVGGSGCPHDYHLSPVIFNLFSTKPDGGGVIRWHRVSNGGNAGVTAVVDLAANINQHHPHLCFSGFRLRSGESKAANGDNDVGLTSDTPQREGDVLR